MTVVPDNHPNQWSSGCASGSNSDREIVRTGSNGIVTAVLVPDGYNTAELEQGGFKKVHENVYAAAHSARSGFALRSTTAGRHLRSSVTAGSCRMPSRPSIAQCAGTRSRGYS